MRAASFWASEAAPSPLMARLRAEIKRGFLRSLWRAAGNGRGASLADCLTAFQDSGFQWIKSGRVILSTSGGGYSSNFTGAEIARELTQEEVFAVSEEFLSILDDSRAALVAAGSATTDAALFATMLADDRMQTVRQTMQDSTMLRYPTSR